MTNNRIGRIPFWAALFDIDQTMLNLSEMYDRHYARTFQIVFGIDARLSDIQYSGKTTPNIFREVCTKHGLEADFVESKLPSALEYVVELTRNTLHKLDGDGMEAHILPGVEPLLVELRRFGVTLGILSGNPPELGHLVLQEAALHSYFSLFTFGTEAGSRPELARLGLNKLRERLGSLSPRSVLVVGDSPGDIEAAHSIGAVSVAVATGSYSIPQLRPYSPGLLFPSLADTQGILRALSLFPDEG